MFIIRPVALKIYNKKEMNENEKKDLENEISIMDKLVANKRNNIEENVIFLRNCLDWEFTTVLVLDLAVYGTLDFHINMTGDCMNEGCASYYFHQLLNALSFIHSNKICHCDVK